MANYNVEIQRFNGSGYDVIYNTANLRKRTSFYTGTGTTSCECASENVQILIISNPNIIQVFPYPIFPFIAFNPNNELSIISSYNLFIESSSKISLYKIAQSFIGNKVQLAPITPYLNSTIENNPKAFYNENGKVYFTIYFY